MASNAVEMRDKKENMCGRLNHYKIIQTFLQRFRRESALKELESILRVKGELGKGVYGTVYDAILMNRKEYWEHDIAIKCVNTFDDEKKRKIIFKRLLREDMAYAFLNALVHQKIVPNFNLVYRSFLHSYSAEEKMCSFLMLMEKANGNLKEFVVRKKELFYKPKVFLGCLLQLFMAILACGIHLDLVHNDLYLKNILYTEIPKTDLVYHAFGETYALCDTTYLFKISDFGICSSPSFLENDHHEMTRHAENNRKTDSLKNFAFSNHILEYVNIPAYCRDAVTLLRSFRGFDVHPICSTFLKNSLELLDRQKPSSIKELSYFVHGIFSDKFLRACGLESGKNFFRMNSFGKKENVQEFYIEGDSNTKKFVISFAVNYIDTGNAFCTAETSTPESLNILHRQNISSSSSVPPSHIPPSHVPPSHIPPSLSSSSYVPSSFRFQKSHTTSETPFSSFGQKTLGTQEIL